MDSYFFVLGRYPSLSTAEILSVLRLLGINFNVTHQSSEITTITVSQKINQGHIINTLGGTVKIGQVFGQASFDQDESQFLKYFDSQFLKENLLPPNVNKIHFAISIYDAGAGPKITDKISQKLTFLNKNLKEKLMEAGFKAGFLRIKGRSISSVSFYKNQLLNKGFELVLLVAPDKIILGKTLNIQDVNSFAKRDIERPKKDKKSGILPVKLARMMINLVSPKSSSVLLDPFCGSGTILMAASPLGIKNIIGADIDGAAISNTKTNLDWLFKEFRLNPDQYKLTLKVSDIRNLDKILSPNIADAIVTEPFLGPPLYKTADKLKPEKLISQLTPLYKESFNVFRRLLKEKGQIVIIFPVFHTKDKDYFIDKKIIDSSEFKILQSLLYSSPGQFVGRQIVHLVKS